MSGLEKHNGNGMIVPGYIEDKWDRPIKEEPEWEPDDEMKCLINHQNWFEVAKWIIEGGFK